MTDVTIIRNRISFQKHEIGYLRCLEACAYSRIDCLKQSKCPFRYENEVQDWEQLLSEIEIHIMKGV